MRVRRWASWLLLLIYTVSYTEVGEFCKAGAFVDHYFEHKQQNQTLTVLEFIQLHYTLDTKKDSDYAKDKQLPFKSDNCTEHMLIMGYVNQDPVVQIKPFSSLKKPEIIWPQKEYFLDVERDIWQPPKQA